MNISYLEAIISGFVQGFGEFLPISSSGHLVILHHYFSYREPQVLFDIFLHLGTILAVFIYFWYDILTMVTKEHRLLWLVILGSFVTAAIGFAFKDIFECLFASIKTVGLMLFVTAAFIIAGEWVSKRELKSGEDPVTFGWSKALIIGFIQGIAIIPGISRSGSTISTGLLLRLGKREAVRFSFLLSIPAVIGALLFKLAQAGKTIAITLPILTGTASAFLMGLVAIRVLLKVVYADRLGIFAIYCILLGTVVLLL